MKRLLGKVLVVLVVVATMAGCRSGAQDPKQVAQQFWNAVRVGDFEKVKPLVTRASAQSMKPEEKGDFNKEGEVVVGAAKVEGERALVETTIKDKGFTIPFQTIVVKEEGKWKVDADQTMVSAMAGAMSSLGPTLSQGMNAAAGAPDDAGRGPERQAAAAPSAAPSAPQAPVAAPAAGLAWKVGDPASVEWKGKWWPASVIEVGADNRWKIHYDGYDTSWDEWVGPERIRKK